MNTILLVDARRWLMRQRAALCLSPIDYILSAFSFEFFLKTKKKRSNGGGIVFLRSALTALVLYLIAIGIHGAAEENRLLTFDPAEMWLDIGRMLHWYGGILVAVYAGLYARFASQWTYLANLYNQIKAAEIKAMTEVAAKAISDESQKEIATKIAQWKAGYIEDAMNLHLATKASVAPIIHFWLEDPGVGDAFKTHTPAGNAKYDELKNLVSAVYNQLCQTEGG